MTDQESLPLKYVLDYVTTHFDGVDVATYPPNDEATAWFFSRDPIKHWPNFATVVTTDEHDMEANSNLAARGAYRVNIGVGRMTFEGLIDPSRDYDYAAADVFMPHPTYANQRWIAIVNPTRATFDEQLKPLLEEAYERLAKPS